jgi:hypothetical protein
MGPQIRKNSSSWQPKQRTDRWLPRDKFLKENPALDESLGIAGFSFMNLETF